MTAEHPLAAMSRARRVALRFVYAGNVFVATSAAINIMISPKWSGPEVFAPVAVSNDAVSTIVASFWLAIAITSSIGFVRPLVMSPVLLIQLLYKAGWLMLVAVPALAQGRTDLFPIPMAIFFAVWVAVLPVVIPWRYLIVGK